MSTISGGFNNETARSATLSTAERTEPLAIISKKPSEHTKQITRPTTHNQYPLLKTLSAAGLSSNACLEQSESKLQLLPIDVMVPQ